MHPTKDKYLSTIVGSVVNVSSTIIAASEIIDLKGILRDIEKYGFEMDKIRTVKDEQEVEKLKKAKRIEQAVLADDRRDVAIKKPILKQRPGILNYFQDLQITIIAAAAALST
jgi:hypothetical protein